MAGELTAVELAARRKGIGASDAGPLFGYGYGTPFTVWADKVYGHTSTVTAQMQRGHDLEDLVAEKAEAKLGLSCLEPCRGQTWSTTNPLMFATLDYADVDDSTIVECKTSDYRNYGHQWGPDDTGPDGLPPSILLQAHHQLQVATWADRVVVAVLFVDNWHLRTYEVPRDATIADLLIEGEQLFWEQHVATRVPPAITDPRRDLAACKSFPIVQRQQILDPASRRWLRAWADANATINDAKMALRQAQAELARELGEADQAEIDGVPALVRSTNKHGVQSTRLLNADKWRTTQ